MNVLAPKLSKTPAASSEIPIIIILIAWRRFIDNSNA